MSYQPPPKTTAGQALPPPRQIRFVSSDGQPQTKRRRVTAACRTCRKRKIRCSGEQPVCKTCSDYGHTCLGYNETGQPEPQEKAESSSEPPISVHLQEKTRSPVSEGSSPPPPSSTTPTIASRQSLESKESTKSPVLKTSTSTKQKPAKSLKQRATPQGESPESSRTSLSASNCTHVPYFRYFGPTAIVPGFKQMVVRVRDGRKTQSQSSESASLLPSPTFNEKRVVVSVPEPANDSSHSIPFYDRDDTLPPSQLVTHLCELFFDHLGCNFVFLQRDRFLKDLQAKQVDTVLVDAVCALSARFSPHPLLSPLKAVEINGGTQADSEQKKSDNGHAFAQRAMIAVVNSFACPTLSAVQACLLLAYEQFGSNHDSGLWMYLGISIRMAQDLGIQKLQGLKFNYGRIGLTPKAIISGQASKSEPPHSSPLIHGPQKETVSDREERAREKERVDTFWGVFFLDRVISSGTGRPVTLRDEDIEICFPLQSDAELSNGWPAPFPPLIRIIHLYGRVTDLINAILEDNHVTPETLKRLAAMETDLTGIYQRLSPKLHFNVVNFQTYVKAGEGTNFILLHFWFHTLIVLLHQPTLLTSFGGKIQQLYPNSRELSMSSAKTIADILSFSELIDAKSFIGNPFTSQPMYIAACAFLMESAYYSSPSSRSGSPPTDTLVTDQTSAFTIPPNLETAGGGLGRSLNSKHSLLASAAKDNYQRCYRALKSLEDYWEGVKYIITVLDQKAKGVGDPLLYTAEEMENTVETPTTPFPVNEFQREQSQSGASRKHESTTTTSLRESGQNIPRASSRSDPTQAIGWAIAGAANSSQSNVSLLYSVPANQTSAAGQNQAIHAHQHSEYPNPRDARGSSHPSDQSYGQIMASYDGEDTSISAHLPTRIGKSEVSRGEMSTLNANYAPITTSFPESHARPPSTLAPALGHNYHDNHMVDIGAGYGYGMLSGHDAPNVHNRMSPAMHPGLVMQVGDMMIESQDVDMNALQDYQNFPFFNGDWVPWLEYLPQEVIANLNDQQYQNLSVNPSDEAASEPHHRPR